MFWNLINKSNNNKGKEVGDKEVIKNNINNFLFYEDSYGYYFLNNTFNPHIAAYEDSLFILKHNGGLHLKDISYKEVGIIRINPNELSYLSKVYTIVPEEDYKKFTKETYDLFSSIKTIAYKQLNGKVPKNVRTVYIFGKRKNSIISELAQHMLKQIADNDINPITFKSIYNLDVDYYRKYDFDYALSAYEFIKYEIDDKYKEELKRLKEIYIGKCYYHISDEVLFKINDIEIDEDSTISLVVSSFRTNGCNDNEKTINKSDFIGRFNNPTELSSTLSQLIKLDPFIFNEMWKRGEILKEKIKNYIENEIPKLEKITLQ